MQYHIIAFTIGYVLDLIIGDPHFMPHPVKAIGKLISYLTKKLLKKDDAPISKRRKGVFFFFLVLLITVLTVGVLLVASYLINIYVGTIVEAVLTYFLLATKSLKDESMRVYKELKKKDIDASRYMVSMIVGRDTNELNEEGITKAAVETVAENTSDGIIAPMLYVAIGGPCLGYLYKAVNTMDSMVGYKNDEYIDFGRCAAKSDDIWNLIPARLSAILMIVGAFIYSVLCKLFLKNKKLISGLNAIKIYARDRYNHKSPNSAHTESVCAGALNIRLAGPASYFGKLVDKPYIGDANREIEIKDIVRANILLYITSLLGFLISILVMYLLL